MNLTEIFLNKLKIETKQVPIDSLFNDEGELKKTQYNPPYQRNYVWDGEKATRKDLLTLFCIDIVSPTTCRRRMWDIMVGMIWGGG